jgi:predicted Zn-dependent peptidase
VQVAQGKDYKVALKIVQDELGRIRDGKVSAAELERAKNQYLLQSYNDLLSDSEIGHDLGEALVTSDNYLRNFEILQQLKFVTVADLQHVAKAYLVDARSNLVHLSPAASAKGKQ